MSSIYLNRKNWYHNIWVGLSLPTGFFGILLFTQTAPLWLIGSLLFVGAVLLFAWANHKD